MGGARCAAAERRLHRHSGWLGDSGGRGFGARDDGREAVEDGVGQSRVAADLEAVARALGHERVDPGTLGAGDAGGGVSVGTLLERDLASLDGDQVDPVLAVLGTLLDAQRASP